MLVQLLMTYHRICDSKDIMYCWDLWSLVIINTTLFVLILRVEKLAIHNQRTTQQYMYFTRYRVADPHTVHVLYISSSSFSSQYVSMRFGQALVDSTHLINILIMEGCGLVGGDKETEFSLNLDLLMSLFTAMTTEKM